MLHAAGIETPSKILAHGWWMGKEGGKISKSSKEVVNPLDLAERYGADQLRYALIREMTVGQDSSYNEESILNRINVDLANDLGNLYSRLAKVWQTGGFSPAKVLTEAPDGIPEELDEQKQVLQYHVQFEIERVRPNVAIEHIFNIVRGLNKLIEQVKPWKAVKTDPDSIVDILTWALGALGEIAKMLSPVMPNKMGDLQEWLYDDSGRIDPTPGKQLFPRMKLVSKSEPKKSDPKKSAKSSASDDTIITFDEFGKVDLRAGKILSASKHPDADKLLLLQVDVGSDQRQVVSGIAKSYAPEDLIGKCVIIVVNLKPAKIRGEKSSGMLLASGDGDSLKVAFLDDDVIPGSKVH
jgi:methionyl-tRNA synthetase